VRGKCAVGMRLEIKFLVHKRPFVSTYHFWDPIIWTNGYARSADGAKSGIDYLPHQVIKGLLTALNFSPSNSVMIKEYISVLEIAWVSFGGSHGQKGFRKAVIWSVI